MEYQDFLSKVRMLSEAYEDSGDEIAVVVKSINKNKDGVPMAWTIDFVLIDDSMKEKKLKSSSATVNAVEKAIGRDDVIKAIEISNDKEVTILFTEALVDEKGNYAIKIGNKTIKIK